MCDRYLVPVTSLYQTQGDIPLCPFVMYCSTMWGIEFIDDEEWK